MAIQISSFAFDQPLYIPGETITLTVNYTTDDSSGGPVDTSYSAQVTVADSSGPAVAVSTDGDADLPFFVINTGTATGPAALPTTVSATDNRPAPGVWTLVSNDVTGDAAPWTGVAVLTSVA